MSNITPLRQISLLEKDYLDANMAIYLHWQTQHSLPQKTIFDGFTKLLEQYPILQMAIVNDELVKQSERHIHQYCQYLEGIPTNASLFDISLNPARQLCQLLISECDKQIEFCFIVHHAIADAMAALKLLEAFQKILENEMPEKTIAPISAGIEHFYQIPTIEETAEYAQSFRAYVKQHPGQYHPLQSISTPYGACSAQFKTKYYDALTHQALKTQAKAANVSFNAYLNALLLKHTQLVGTVYIGTAVDLRSRIPHQLPQNDICSAPVGAFFDIHIEKDDLIATIAQKYTQALQSFIQSPALLLQHYAVLREQINVFDLHCAFFFSNAGETRFNSAISPLIKSPFFAAKAMMNCPYFTCLRHQGNMMVTATYPSPWIAKTSIDDYFSAMNL